MCRIIPFAPSPDCIAPSDATGSCPSRRNPGPPTALSSRMLREFNGLPQAYVGSTRLQRPVSVTLPLLVCFRGEYFSSEVVRALNPPRRAPRPRTPAPHLSTARRSPLRPECILRQASLLHSSRPMPESQG